MYDILHPCGDKLMAESDAARYNRTTERSEKSATRTGNILVIARAGNVPVMGRPDTGLGSVATEY